MSARLSRTTASGLLLVGLAAAGCATGSARSDYYTARAVVYPSAEGDGSVIAVEQDPAGAPWSSSSLTFVPMAGSGDLADNR